MTFDEMLSTYDRLAYAHNYIFGFEKDGEIFATTCTAEILPSICYLDRASRGQGSAIRFRPNREQKALLASQSTTFRLCSAESLEKAKAESKYNRGEIFEKFVTEFFGQKWRKDHIPFTEGGDIEVDGIAYQVKFAKATFTNEKTLLRMAG